MKKLKKILLGVLVVVVLLVISFYLYLRHTLPELEGELTVKGIEGEVVIERNRWGVPAIEAQTLNDLFFAVGFVHAQDRLFQMDLLRRLATGRLSEIFGERTLESDRYHRDLLVEEAIEKALEDVDRRAKPALESYCAGINFFIRDRTLPPEFRLLGYTPEEWRIRDIFAIFKNMELTLAGSGSELYNLRLTEALGRENVDGFLSGIYGPTIIDKGEAEALSRNRTLTTLLRREVLLMEHSIGSNNWVISGSRTATGQPILANDPHLANVFPSHFYQVHAKTGDLELSGNTIPGTPFIVIGRNRQVGWGFTNVGTDVIDYFILKINPHNRNQYEYEGQWLDFGLIRKKIKVKDREVDHTIKTSKFGPVLEEGKLVLARHSIGQYRSTVLSAFYQMNMARNLREFLEGVKKFTSPAQNVVFADTDGNIGYYPSGLVPRRRKGNGEIPLSAAGAADMWAGFYPEEEKPLLLNPPKGYVVTANNPVLPEGHLPIFSKNWFYSPSFRAERIDELIRAKARLSIADNKEIQTDTLLKGAQFLVGKIGDFSFDSEEARFVRDHLKEWNFRADEGPAPYLFYRFQYHLAQNLFRDHMGDKQYRPLISTSWVYKLLNYPTGTVDDGQLASWADDIATPEKEDFREMVKRSLEDTHNEYIRKSKDAESRWEILHTLTYRHPLGSIPLLNTLLNRGPFPMKGGDRCVLSTDFDREFKINWLPTFRLIMDFSDFSHSLLVNSSGQSGHFLSPHYDDQVPLYVGLRYRKMEDFPPHPRKLKLVPGEQK